MIRQLSSQISPTTDGSQDVFALYDMGCAAALVSAGFELQGLDKSNPRKVRFLFSKISDIEEASEKYWSGSLNASARGLFENIKMLKNRIYSD